MAKSAQGAALDRKKLMADPIMVTTIVLLITFLTLFILYPLVILLIDSVLMDGHVTLDVFRRIMNMPTFTRAITNTLKVGFVVGILSTVIGPVQGGLHAARGVPALRAELVHDHALRQGGPHHPVPAGHL